MKFIYKKKLIIITALFIISSLLSIYIYQNNQKLKVENNQLKQQIGSKSSFSESKELFSKVINNCLQSLKASSKLNTNCGGAYKEVTGCFADLESCDIKKSTDKLQNLQEEQNNINIQIKDLTDELKSLIGTSGNL